jgi:hypothetical protein
MKKNLFLVLALITTESQTLKYTSSAQALRQKQYSNLKGNFNTMQAIAAKMPSVFYTGHLTDDQKKVTQYIEDLIKNSPYIITNKSEDYRDMVQNLIQLLRRRGVTFETLTSRITDAFYPKVLEIDRTK